MKSATIPLHFMPSSVHFLLMFKKSGHAGILRKFLPICRRGGQIVAPLIIFVSCMTLREFDS